MAFQLSDDAPTPSAPVNSTPPPSSGVGNDEQELSPVYPGSNNNFSASPYPSVGALPNAFTWKKDIRDILRQDVRGFASAMGQPRSALDTWFEQQIDPLVNWLSKFVLGPDIRQAVQESTRFESSGYERAPVGVNAQHPRAGEVPDLSGMIDPFSQEGMMQLRTLSSNYLSQFLPGFDVYAQGGAGGGGGGGGGSRKPTPDEIRALFDIDALTRKIQQMGRGYLIEEVEDARSVAEAYVEAIVKTGGEQEIEFDTYVINRLKKSDRWTQLYRNKPDGVDELQYISQYAAVAQQMLGGNRGKGIGKVVGQGAALAGSPDAFMNRVAREDTVRNSSNFINSLEKRMSGVSQVLRG